jgi:hypothetical protein
MVILDKGKHKQICDKAELNNISSTVKIFYFLQNTHFYSFGLRPFGRLLSLSPSHLLSPTPHSRVSTNIEMAGLKEQRTCIKFCFMRNKTAAETHQMLKEAFGEQARTLEWFE